MPLFLFLLRVVAIAGVKVLLAFIVVLGESKMLLIKTPWARLAVLMFGMAVSGMSYAATALICEPGANFYSCDAYTLSGPQPLSYQWTATTPLSINGSQTSSSAGVNCPGIGLGHVHVYLTFADGHTETTSRSLGCRHANPSL